METREAKILRILYHLNRSSISQFDIGNGAVKAQVDGEHRIQGPITGRPCIGYALSIQNYTDYWNIQHLYYETVCADFKIRDEESSGSVKGATAWAALNRPVEIYSQFTPINLIPILQVRGIQGHLPYWILRETILCSDDTAVIAGQGRRVPMASHGGSYRQAPESRLEIGSSETLPLLISNCASVAMASRKAVNPQFID